MTIPRRRRKLIWKTGRVCFVGLRTEIPKTSNWGGNSAIKKKARRGGAERANFCGYGTTPLDLDPRKAKRSNKKTINSRKKKE